MVKQLKSKDIKNYLRTGPKKILLDVRTQEEWDSVGKPDGDKIELKTHFLEIKRNSIFDFVKDFHPTISEVNPIFLAVLHICLKKQSFHPV